MFHWDLLTLFLLFVVERLPKRWVGQIVANYRDYSRVLYEVTHLVSRLRLILRFRKVESIKMTIRELAFSLTGVRDLQSSNETRRW